jgi:hypothetical protein
MELFFIKTIYFKNWKVSINAKFFGNLGWERIITGINYVFGEYWGGNACLRGIGG